MAKKGEDEMGLPMQRRKYDMKPYRRGQIVFKIGLMVFMVIPPSIYYYMKHKKDLYARGMVKDMERMNQMGRSMHEIPKYSHQDGAEGKRIQLWH